MRVSNQTLTAVRHSGLRTAVFTRLGKVAIRWRWLVVGAWLALTIAGAAGSGGLFDHLRASAAERPDSESPSAQRRIERLTPEGPLVIGVIQGRDPYDPVLVGSVTEAAHEIEAMPGVKGVDDLYTSPGGQIGSDNRSTTVRVELRPDLADATREQVEDR